LVNAIGPLVALNAVSLWIGVLAIIACVAVATVIVSFDRRLVRGASSASVWLRSSCRRDG